MEFKAFENKDGKGLVSVRISASGSYFRLSRPVTAAWYDNEGTTAKYLCQLPYDQQEREAIIKYLGDGLYNNYADDLEGLKTLLTPLLEVFPKGHYVLQFHDGDKGDFFRTRHSGSPDTFNWSLIASTMITDVSTIAEKEKAYGAYIVDKYKHPQYDLITKTTNGFYVGNEVIFVATQPSTEINEDRVGFFEEQIARGERPFAIILRSVYKRGDDMAHAAESDYYVIDGHHKLLAYVEQNVVPRVAVLTHYAESREEVNFDAEELLEVLYPWQMKHLLDNWWEKPAFIAGALQNPDSGLHVYIRNGLEQEYHENGQLKHEALYVNGGIEGTARWWYEDGTPEKAYTITNGVYNGLSEGWYRNGVPAHAMCFDEKGRQHGESLFYHVNGSLRSKQLLEHGKPVEGKSYTGWYDDGKIEFEHEYNNGKLIGWRRYDRQGKLELLEEWDQGLGKLVRRVSP